MQLIFESHATSIDNERGIASGWLDPSLSEKGREQALDLGKRYASFEFSMIYTSDLCRSYQTAQLAFEGRPIPIIKDSRLREWNYGEFNGSPSHEVESLKRYYLTNPFPGGESLQEAIQRFSSFVEDHLHKAKGPFLLIGHRATYYACQSIFGKVALDTLVTRPWAWQPGWHFRIR